MQKINILILLLLLSIKSHSQTKNFIDQPFIETEVEIDSLIVPDRIFLTITLDESDSRNKKSTEELEVLMYKVLKSLQIDTEKNLSILDFSSDFKKHFLSGQKILKTKMFSLLVKDAIIAGKVLTGLERMDISNVSIDRSEYSKAQELILDLKSKAILKAKKYAESMTKPIDQKVGSVLFISDLNANLNRLQGQVAGIRIRGASSIYGSRGSAPMIVEFNKIKFTARMNVKFKIE